MPIAIKEALERISMLAEGLDPEEQAYALEQLESLAIRLENDRKWDDLLASPESQAYLTERGQVVLAEYEAGKTEEGGWE